MLYGGKVHICYADLNYHRNSLHTGPSVSKVDSTELFRLVTSRPHECIYRSYPGKFDNNTHLEPLKAPLIEPLL